MKLGMGMGRVLVTLMVGYILCAGAGAAEPDENGFVTIFDGQTLDGWKANEPTINFKVEDGCIVGFGERCHLFYMEPLKNFEILMDVSINNQGNSGVYVKSPWVDSNWPTGGFELQVNNSARDLVKTGSLYDLILFFKAPHGDDEWFTYHVICKDEKITVKINGEILYTYVDPAGKRPATNADGKPIKHLGQVGHIALQQHDPGSTPRFKNIKIKKL